MNEKLNKFESLVEQKKDNYKNICLLWKNWIKIKKEKFENELNIAINKLESVESHLNTDISIETLLFLVNFIEINTNELENPLDPK